MTNNDIGRLVGGAFMALCNALGSGRAEIACDTLRHFADDPNVNPEVRHIFHCMAETGDGAEQIERPRLEVIQGGAA